MLVNAGSAIGALPEPAILALLNSIQEELADLKNTFFLISYQQFPSVISGFTIVVVTFLSASACFLAITLMSFSSSQSSEVPSSSARMST